MEYYLAIKGNEAIKKDPNEINLITPRVRKLTAYKAVSS